MFKKISQMISNFKKRREEWKIAKTQYKRYEEFIKERTRKVLSGEIKQ